MLTFILFRYVELFIYIFVLFLVMQAAWRERVPAARIKAAHLALEKNPECVTALIMLAEEEAPSMLKVEKIFRKALKLAEANYKKTQKSHHLDSNIEMQHSNNCFN